MLPSNVQTIQDSVPSDLVEQTVRTLVATFLSRLAGIPVHKLEAALGPERKTLPELTLMDFLWSGDGSYFPAFCSLYLLGEPVWSEQERHIHSFLEFARDLYAERGVGPHRLRDICTELGTGGRAPVQPISLIVGAHLSRSFGNYYHSFQGSPGVDLTHVEPGSAIKVPEIRFHLTPNILDYKDLDTSWQEQIQPRLVRARTASVAVSGATPQVDSSSTGNRLEEHERIQSSSERSGRATPAQTRADTQNGGRRSAAPTSRSAPRGTRRQPVKATILNVLIASPSDVSAERDAVESAIQEWNGNYHERMGIMLQAVRWETHSYPASGDRPQAILNKQIVESGDILIGIFGYKLGTPTGKAQSGTIEEIEEFRNAGKYVALYFSKADVPRTADLEQLKALGDYQRERQKDTLYGAFQSTEELRRLVTQHLPKIVAEVSRGIGDSALSTPSIEDDAFFERKADLSPKEMELLWNAAKAPVGEILHNETLNGESIRVNGRQFLAGVDARTGAEWTAAFRNLEKRGFIEPLSQGSDFFRVTGEGYQAADALEEFARWDAKSVVLRAHYLNAPSDEITLSCTGIIAIPARYFGHQIGADGVVQRSLKEPRSLLVEGVPSKPAMTWSPIEIEFLDPASKQLQSFRVEGMEFLRPRSLKLPLAAEIAQAASESADDGLHEFVQVDLVPATDEVAAAAEPESESRPEGFLVGSRNAWAGFLERCWPIVGPQILSIAQERASTIDDVRRAFLPAREHPYDSGLGTHFYRERTQQATPADVVSTGKRFDQVAAKVIQTTADKDQATRSCAEAEAALALARNPREKEKVQSEAQRRRRDFAQFDAKLADLQCTQKELEETFKDQQAYVCRSEMLDFLHAAEQPVDPRHIANAVAALPHKTWRESVALFSSIPFDSYVQHEYQVFLVISAILNDHASDLSGGAVDAFRRALLKLPPGSPGQPFFWDNWGDLKAVLEEFGNSGPLDPFRLTDTFLKRAMRQKDPLERVLANSERLRK